MYSGSCECGEVQLELDGEPDNVLHCFCRKCQKQHGAAYATYARFKLSNIRYVKGESTLKSYASSSFAMRRFCSECGSNVEWSGTIDNPTMSSIALACIDPPFSFGPIDSICTDEKADWSSIP